MNRINSLLRLATLLASVISFSLSYASSEPGIQQGVVATLALQNTEEIAILKAQLDVHKEYTQHLLSTVYWSLGGILGVAILLAGFGWFANIKVYERDRESLGRELHGKLDQALSTLKAEHHDQIRLVTESIPQAIDSATGKALGQIRSQLKGLRSQNAQEIGELKCAFAKIERESWLREDVVANALLCAVDHLDAALIAQSEYEIGKALEHIRDDLSELVTKRRQQPMDAFQIQELESLLSAAESQHRVLVATIRQFIAQGAAL